MKTAREKVQSAAADNGWAEHATGDEFVDEYRLGRRHVRITADTYGRLTLVTTESHRYGGAGKIERALEALTR